MLPVPRAAHCPLAPPADFANWRAEPGLQRAMFHGHLIWVVSRYHDIRAALVDPRLSAKTIPEFDMLSDSMRLGVDGSRSNVEQIPWPARSTGIGINTTRVLKAGRPTIGDLPLISAGRRLLEMRRLRQTRW